MNARITLTPQEFEFALACRDFLGETDSRASQRIELHGCEMIVPGDDRLRQDFLDFGVAKLMKTFQMAIENRAMPLDQATSIITSLAVFNEKVLSALVTRSTGSQH